MNCANALTSLLNSYPHSSSSQLPATPRRPHIIFTWSTPVSGKRLKGDAGVECGFIKKFLNRRHVRHIGEYTDEGFRSLISYLRMPPRQMIAFHSEKGGYWNVFNNDFCPDVQNRGPRAKDLVATPGFSGEGRIARQLEGEGVVGYVAGRNLSVESRGKRRRMNGNRKILTHPQEFVDLFDEIVCAPVRNMYLTNAWSGNDSFVFSLKQDKSFIRACSMLETRFFRFTFLDFVEYYKGKNPMFVAYDGDIWVKYYDIENSMSIAKELLMFQFNDENFKSS